MKREISVYKLSKGTGLGFRNYNAYNRKCTKTIRPAKVENEKPTAEENKGNFTQ